MFVRINLLRQQQELIHASSFKLIMVPDGEPDIKEPGTDAAIAALCEDQYLLITQLTQVMAR